MENQQQQMPQGQPGPAPEQMQAGQPQGQPQGPPQQGGQDPQIQQITEMVQQLMQQGAQPVDAAAELLNQQVPPEVIMQVFVEMGMPQEDAQAAIEQAMQGGQQQQNPAEEQMEQDASNPDEESVEDEATEIEQPEMSYGGGLPRRLRRAAKGGDNAELQGVMQQVQEMMSQGSDARQVMQQIQAAAQQGQISPETAAAVMEQLGGMQQATNPQGDDAAMTQQSQDPQQLDPNMPAPDQQMARFGGNLKNLLSKAYGGSAVAPGIDSKDYTKDRTSMFVNAVKNSMFKSTLDNEFPSLGGMKKYGGDIPKAVNGYNVQDYKSADEAELAARRYAEGLDPEKAKGFDWKTEVAKWKAPEQTYEAGKNYQYDPATKQWKASEANAKPEGYDVGYGYGKKYGTKEAWEAAQANAHYGASGTNPVGYENPMGQGLWGNVAAGTSPLGRFLMNSGNRYTDPRITGSNLPGGMSGAQFLGAAGQNGLTPGMTGTIGDQTWRIGAGEKFKEGSIWKGNRRKGVRYEIDWGSAAAMNPATNPAAVASAPVSNNAPGYTPNAAAPGYSGYNADANGNNIPDYLQESTGTSSWNRPSAGNPTALSNMTPTGGSGMGAMEQNIEEFPSLATQPSNTNTADQTLINPAGTDLINPASEVNQIDQSAANLNGYPQNNQGQAPVFNGQQPMMSATAQDQVQQAPGVVQNSNYATYGNPTNTGVPGEFTPAEDLLPVGTENTTVVQKPGATVVQTPLKKKTVFSKVKPDLKHSMPFYVHPLDNVVKTATQTEDERTKAWNEKTAISNAEYDKAQEAAKAEAAKKPILHSSTDYQKRLDQMQKDNNGQWSDEMQKFVDLKAQAEKREKGVQPKKKAPLMGKNLNVQAYGGGVSHADLSNAINLINRAFGGSIPKAFNGMDLGPSAGIEVLDENGNPITSDGSNMMWNNGVTPTVDNTVGSPTVNSSNKGTVEQSNGKKLNIDWNAAGDMAMSGASKLTNFMNKVHAYNPERERAKDSALNRSSDTYDTMSQGLYGQAGDFIPNDIGNQVLNPTNVGFNNQQQIFSYGGKVYAIGGDVDLEDDEMEQLAAAGFKFSRV